MICVILIGGGEGYTMYIQCGLDQELRKNPYMMFCLGEGSFHIVSTHEFIGRKIQKFLILVLNR